VAQTGLNSYLIVFALIAFVSATQDIAIDGFYLDVLTENQQAFYVGIRNTAYRGAWLFGSGAMVSLAGYYAELAKTSQNAVAEGWALAFGICALAFVIATAWHLVFLPKLQQYAHPVLDRSDHKSPDVRLKRFVDAFISFADQPRFAVIVLYILTFRMGDSFLLKMAQPFLLDPMDKGGLGISTAQVGLIYGTVGISALLIGGIVGGMLVAKYGLKRCLMPAAIFQNSAILLYWALAIFKPGLMYVGVVNALEQFAYGLGFTTYTVFLLSVVKSEYRAAH
jgi:PAT family beta-lactamase induction signal transducer AmpG